jgi:ABC-2 type transport system ATP-binding protein
MPVLSATGAGVRHRRRWIFRDLDVIAEPGDLVAVVGVPGSGRTTVMLALARRFRLSAGKVDLFGTAALGYVPDVEQPEPVFSVAEHVRERLALLGRPSRDAATVLADGLYGLDPALKGWQLTPYQKQVLGLALARLGNPAVIALDGVDDGLDAGEQAELWRILGELAAAGVAVVVTAREIDPDRVATVIRLADQQTPDRPASDPSGSDTAASGLAASNGPASDALASDLAVSGLPAPGSAVSDRPASAPDAVELEPVEAEPAVDEAPTEPVPATANERPAETRPVADEEPRGAPRATGAESTTGAASGAGARNGEQR